MRFIKDYIDFKNYVNDILNSNFKNIVENAEKILYVRRESKVDENVERQTILEKKVQNLSEENKHLKTEVESYKIVIQLLTTEKSNVTNSWQYVSRKNASTNNKNVLSKITTTPLNNFYEPLIDFQLERNEYDENEGNITLSKVNSIAPKQFVKKDQMYAQQKSRYKINKKSQEIKLSQAFEVMLVLLNMEKKFSLLVIVI